MTLSADQILALAPDAASAKAGSGLASPSKWQNCGATEQALWGECQGSGKDPYRAQIELAEPAFKCSCPSRKFPCKHGLGLYLLFAARPGHFSNATPPPWVADWLAGRQKRSEKKEEKKQATQDAAPLSPEQQAAAEAAVLKRDAKRQSRLEGGLQELQKWLEDLAREGYADVRQRGTKPWDDMAARLVDAQAPGVAARLRRAGSWPFLVDVPRWEEYLSRDLASLYLFACTAQAPHAVLHEDDRKSLVGIAKSQEEVLAGDSVADSWQVLGQRHTEEDRLRLRSTWLYGLHSKRLALVLHYAAGTLGYNQTLLPDTRFDGELVFYPGAVAQRALVKTLTEPVHSGLPLPPLGEPWGQYALALAAQPFLERFAVVVQGAPVLQGGQWLFRTREGGVLALHPQFRAQWQLLALSGGAAVAVFGEWDGDCLMPWSVQIGGRVCNLDSICREAA